MTILYFSSTGNCIYVAKQLGGEILSIPQMIREKRYEFTDEKIGIITPIYETKTPPYVLDFINKATFNTKYLFVVMTFGMIEGNAAKHLEKYSNKDFRYINAIKMVDNWLPGFDMKKQIANVHKKKVPEQIQSIKKDIDENTEFIRSTNIFGKAQTAYFQNRDKDIVWENEIGIKEKVLISDKCTACGVCAKVCPLDNITIDKEVRTVYYGNQCVSCMGCIHHCTSGALSLKRERSDARYINENIKLSEIINANN